MSLLPLLPVLPILPAHHLCIMQGPNRLRHSRDFARARRGRSLGNHLVVLHATRSGGAALRCGFVVSKRVGSAVRRNRVKRRLREIVRRLLPAVPCGWDLVLTCRPPAASASFAELVAAVEDVLRRAQLRAVETSVSPPPAPRSPPVAPPATIRE